MKKLFVFLLLFCLIATSLAGCDNTKPLENNQVDDNDVTCGGLGLPISIAFRSIDDIINLKNLMDKSDEEILEYRKEFSWELYPIYSGEDIKEFFSKMGDVPFLYLKEDSGYKLSLIEYRINYGMLYSVFVSDDGHVRFEHYLPDSKASKPNADEFWENSPLPLAKEKITVLNKPVGFRIFEASKNPAIYRILGVFEFSDLPVRLILSNNEKKDFNLEAIEANIVETTINKLMEENKVE